MMYLFFKIPGFKNIVSVAGAYWICEGPEYLSISNSLAESIIASRATSVINLPADIKCGADLRALLGDTPCPNCGAPVGMHAA